MQSESDKVACFFLGNTVIPKTKQGSQEISKYGGSKSVFTPSIVEDFASKPEKGMSAPVCVRCVGAGDRRQLRGSDGRGASGGAIATACPPSSCAGLRCRTLPGALPPLSPPPFPLPAAVLLHMSSRAGSSKRIVCRRIPVRRTVDQWIYG